MTAALASQAYQLSWLLALQHQNFNSALTATKQAFRYGDLADDNQLRVSSLVRQAHVYFHLRRPLQQLQLHQKALQYSTGISPLLQGWLYVVLAESQAHLGQIQEALRSLGQASDAFPDHPEEDPHFSYVPVDHFFFANHAALTYLHMSQPVKAWETLAHIEKTVPAALVPRRAELLCRQASASFHLGDLEQACTYVEHAGTAALQLGSDLRYSEASETYQQIQLKWPHEQRVKSLGELFLSM
jgi:tetratricopeptide (TPR) repeat protein